MPGSKDIRVGERFAFRGHACMTWAAAVERRMVNPLAQLFVVPQGFSYL
jgi:hypothetical protein